MHLAAHCSHFSLIECILFPRKFVQIETVDQRRQYKQEFNKEYSEYQELHQEVDIVARKFQNLRTQINQTEEGSPDFEVWLLLWNCFNFFPNIHYISVLYISFDASFCEPFSLLFYLYLFPSEVYVRDKVNLHADHETALLSLLKHGTFVWLAWTCGTS